MLHFRTVLLWLAFVLLVLQYFLDIRSHIILGMIYRLSPSAILLLWFLLTIFMNDQLKINTHALPKKISVMLQVLRPLASISIVAGAILKIMHLPFSEILLVSGIGFMAVYSTILSRFALVKSKNNHEIVDDMEE